jgi:hypothetical protein
MATPYVLALSLARLFPEVSMSPSDRPDDAVLAEIRHVLRQVQASLDAAAARVREDAEAALDDILASRLLATTLLLKLDTSAASNTDAAETGTLPLLQ